jgi:C_GCAxxG_C_C family probable redox protein
MEVTRMERNAEIEALVGKYAQQYPNCAEMSFVTMADYLKLDVDVADFARALTAFPGIGRTGETCGAVTGALLAIGLAIGPTEPMDAAGNQATEMVGHKFAKSVSAALGSTSCADIIEGMTGTRYDLADPEDAQKYLDEGGLQKCVGAVITTLTIGAEVVKEAKAPAV